MPVLPLVGSIIVVFFSMRPWRSAASIMARAIRSLTLQSGFMLSILPRTSAVQPSVIRRIRTSGVLPTHWVILSKIFPERAAVMLGTPSLFPHTTI